MPPSAATESHIAAQSSAASNSHTHTHSHSHTHASHPDHDPAESSDAETEPLPYDDAAEEDRNSDIVMDPNELAHHTRAVVDTDADAPGEEIADVSMERSIHDQQESSQAEDLADHPDDDEDDEEEDEDGEGEDALPASQATATHDPNSNMSSPQKTGAFTGDEFSDESELTDEDEDQNEDEDASSLSDDDLGGSDNEDEEDEEDDDPDSKTHEDEAAEALAALTGGADSANDDASAAAAGLDALAMLATAGDAEADHGDEDEEDEDDQASDAEGEDADAAGEAGASLDEIAKHARLQQLRQEADGDDLSSDITPEPEDGEIDGAAGADDGSDQEDDATPRDTDLDLIASMKKRAAATGGATSLLEPEQLVDSLPGSAASSRAASPLGDEDEDADKAKSAEDHEGDADAKAPEAEQAEAEHLHTAAGTPAPDAAEHDEDTSTDEAAIRRQEAMEALTKIEIGFAMLRDRLYVERLQEISKEGDMILDGTHPELLHLTKAIEMRRQRRTQLVEMWFEQQEQQYERVAKAEEFAAWSIWRSSCASLRRDMMDEFSRKRRRLDREKRTLDAPRPARRHQIFETELVRNPDRLHIPLEPSMTAEEAERGEANGNKSGRKASAKRKALAREIEAGDEFVAYPDLKGLAEADVMMDIEQMGIRPVGVPPGMYDPFYGPPVGLEFQNPDVYAMYGPEAAAAAAAAAQAHMNGFPYGLPPGARGLPPPPPGMMAPGTPGSAHTPHRHGMHPLPPPPGHMHPMEMGMMPFDPYAAAEMERAARMHHREQQARMGGMDPNDPHHRSSPFPPDMYPPPYPPHFNLPPGAAGGGPGGPGMGGGGRGGMPTSPTPPRRKERASLEESVSVSGRGRGAAKTSGRSSKQSRSSQAPSAPPREGHVGAGGASPSHTKTKTNLPPPPSMSSSTGGLVDEREHKPTSNGAAARGPSAKQSQGVAGIKGLQQQQPPPPAAATPVAVAASAGVANARLYPPSQTSTKSS